MSTSRRRKNLRKIPRQIRTQIYQSESEHWQVGSVRKLSTSDIRAGDWRHLRLILEKEELVHPGEVIPDPGTGRYSGYNCHGREITLEDLPMRTVCWTVEAPNYGDPRKGTHEVEFCKPAYQRDYWPPRFLSIQIEHLGEDVSEDAQIIKFCVSEILHRSQDDFEDRLLYNLNLLQENVRAHGVFPSDATREDYLTTLYVNWEILPPGKTNETVAKIVHLMQVNGNPRLQQAVRDRQGFLELLDPESYVIGTNSFHRYFGAKFADDLVVFENLEYGNALYIMFDDWRELSQRSRTDLLASHKDRFARVVHRKGWKKKAKRIILDELEKRQYL